MSLTIKMALMIDDLVHAWVFAIYAVYDHNALLCVYRV